MRRPAAAGLRAPPGLLRKPGRSARACGRSLHCSNRSVAARPRSAAVHGTGFEPANHEEVDPESTVVGRLTTRALVSIPGGEPPGPFRPTRGPLLGTSAASADAGVAQIGRA